MNRIMIIRNCSAFDKQYNECHSKIEPHKLYCMDCTDCILKQIVDECKRGINNSQCNCGAIGNLVNILDKLDIQEVE